MSKIDAYIDRFKFDLGLMAHSLQVLRDQKLEKEKES